MQTPHLLLVLPPQTLLLPVPPAATTTTTPRAHPHPTNPIPAAGSTNSRTIVATTFEMALQTLQELRACANAY